jgi:hypothetical protein
LLLATRLLFIQLITSLLPEEERAVAVAVLKQVAVVAQEAMSHHLQVLRLQIVTP